MTETGGSLIQHSAPYQEALDKAGYTHILRYDINAKKLQQQKTLEVKKNNLEQPPFLPECKIKYWSRILKNY